jgi:NAD(P) transhydrogenase subunit beta
MGNLLTIFYLVAGAMFILSLAGLSRQDTARRGNYVGMLGMGLALLAALLHPEVHDYGTILVPALVGAVVGAVMARSVAMTSMPELVALLHSFVGLAAVLVGFSTYLAPGHVLHGAEAVIHDIEIFLDVGIGALTFTGSVVAWGKLSGRMSGSPLLLEGRHQYNAVGALLCVLLVVPFTMLGQGPAATMLLLAMTLIAGALGAHLVLAIGGADMPVVVSLLNSYSGWTAAAAGFMLGNHLLIITGALVGSSGAILSYIMCEAMNRSIWNVVFGGFGTGDASGSGAAEVHGEVVAIEVDDLAQKLREAKSVVVIPGYGMAVAQAQHTVREVADLLRKQGKQVRFAIHPVAGRLPGHMNVLLAEAGVPYDIVLEMEEINDDFDDTDVAVVIGANDIVNPGALSDPGSPIYGMPVLECWKAGTAVVLKRSLNVGYAGVGNPLFVHERARMLFGDAKDTMGKLAAALR